MMQLLISLSENDKRVILALLIVVILVFVIIGVLGMIIIRVTKWQGKKMDTLVSDVITTRVITDKKAFFPYARKKNFRLFFGQAWLPLLLILVGVAALVIHNCIVGDTAFNPFNHIDGFGTLLFIWDFEDAGSWTQVFGMKVLSQWPPLLENYGQPQFVKEAWASYIFVPTVFVGTIWYLVAVQACIGRSIRTYQLSKQVFEKSLDGFNQNTPFSPGPQPPQN